MMTGAQCDVQSAPVVIFRFVTQQHWLKHQIMKKANKSENQQSPPPKKLTGGNVGGASCA